MSVNIAYESGDLVCTNIEGAPVGNESALNTTCLADAWYWVSDGESQGERKASSTHHWTNIGMYVQF